MKWWIIYNVINDEEDMIFNSYAVMGQFKTKKEAKIWIKNAPEHYRNIKLFKEVSNK